MKRKALALRPPAAYPRSPGSPAKAPSRGEHQGELRADSPFFFVPGDGVWSRTLGIELIPSHENSSSRAVRWSPSTRAPIGRKGRLFGFLLASGKRTTVSI